MKKKIPLTHLGEMLYDDFMKPNSIARYRLAKDIDISAIRIGKIIEENAISSLILPSD